MRGEGVARRWSVERRKILREKKILKFKLNFEKRGVAQRWSVESLKTKFRKKKKGGWPTLCSQPPV